MDPLILELKDSDGFSFKLMWDDNTVFHIGIYIKHDNDDKWIFINEYTLENDLSELGKDNLQKLKQILTKIAPSKNDNYLSKSDDYTIEDPQISRDKFKRYISYSEKEIEENLKNLDAVIFVEELKEGLNKVASENNTPLDNDTIVKELSYKIFSVDHLVKALRGGFFRGYPDEILLAMLKNISDDIKDFYDIEKLKGYCNLSSIYPHILEKCYDKAMKPSQFFFLLEAATRPNNRPDVKLKMLKQYKLKNIVQNKYVHLRDALDLLTTIEEIKVFFDKLTSISSEPIYEFSEDLYKFNESIFDGQTGFKSLLFDEDNSDHLDCRQRVERAIYIYQRLYDYAPMDFKTSIVKYLFDDIDEYLKENNLRPDEDGGIRNDVIQQMLGNLKLFVHGVDGYVILSKNISAEQQAQLYDALETELPSFVKSFEDFQAIHDILTPENQNKFYNKMVERVDNDPNTIVDPHSSRKAQERSLNSWNQYVSAHRVGAPIQPTTHETDDSPWIEDALIDESHLINSNESGDLKNTILQKIDHQIKRIQQSEVSFLKGSWFLRKGTEKILAFENLRERIDALPANSGAQAIEQTITDWENASPENQSIKYRQIVHKHRLGLEEYFHLGPTDSENAIEDMKTTLKR